MAIELVIPSAGESVTKVLIGAWHKQEGQRVEKDETIVEIETDKATMEVPSPVAGVLGKVLKKAGEPANVGDVIGVIDAGAGAAAGGASSVVASAGATSAATAGAGSASAAAGRTASAGGTNGGAAAGGPGTAVATPPGAAARVMPAAQRVLGENKLQPGDIASTGPGGRLLKEDVLRHLEGGAASNRPGVVEGDGRPAGGVAAPVAVASPAVRSAAYTGLNAAAEAAGPRHEEPVLMTPMRQKIAQRLVDAQHTAAILTTFNEVDLTAVMALRKEHQEAFEKKYKLKLGFMSFFVKGAIDALKLIPQVNAEIRVQPGADGQPAPHVVYRNYYDIGVAVSGGKGLVVPVIRNAERLSFAEIEMVIADFGARARDNKIKLDELTGGTFTISNGGIFGSLMSTPILNPPQSGILGMHAIQERPVARDGQVVIRPMMYIALSYDHRIIDGREAVTFLKRIKECVENPARMLIEV